MNKMIKLVLAGTLSLVTSNAFSAMIGGALNLTGVYTATGGSDLSDATGIDLSNGTVSAVGSSGDFTLTINFPPPAGVGTSASISPFVPVINFLTIGDWQLDLSSLNIVDQTESLLSLTGNGVLTGNGFDATSANWAFSAESVSSYSMTITTVPVPAAVWLFGTGLICLVGVARRKA